ncbi:MAG: C25 family cysteine peptidase, partial [Thermoplasmatota archaeon]
MGASVMQPGRAVSIAAALLLLTSMPVGLATDVGEGAGPATAHRVSLRFEAWASSESYLGEEWGTIDVSGCARSLDPGRPMLPYRVINLELPGPLEGVEASFGDPVRYEGLRLLPAPPYELLGLDELDTSRPLVDSSFYSRDAVYPLRPYEVHKIGEGKSEDGQRVWAYNIIINPLRYNPAREEATLYRQWELDLRYDETPHPFPAPRGTEEKYIIITSTAVNSSGTLQPLIDWKTKKGLPAVSYDIAWIDANYPGWDTAERLRNFLQDKYYNNSLEWVQIVGDHESVPARLCDNPWPIAPYDDEWMPTDTYYACLDAGTTWDSFNHNHTYGELFDTNGDGLWDSYDLDDAYPDVWVARFASSDVSKVTTWVNNVVSYERSPASGDWMDTCTLLAPDAGSAGNATWMRNKVEEFVTKNPQGLYGYLGGLYGTINRLYEANGTLSRAALISALNSGFAFGTWISHGMPDYITSSGPPGTLLHSSDVASLTNGNRKPVLFGMSCLTGWFDGRECLAEALTESNLANGAIGYVGSARVTLGNLNYGYEANGVGIQMDFMHMMELGKTMNSQNLYIGRALLNGKYAFASVWFPFWEAATKAFFEFNLFGEVNCPIWTESPPDINPQTVISENPGYKEVTVTVRDAMHNTPLNRSLVCLVDSASGVYRVNTTGVDGKCKLFVPSSLTTANITVTRADYRPAEYLSSMIDTFPPFTELITAPAVPDGENDWYKTAPQITLRAEDAVQTFLRWDSQSFTPYTGPQTAPEGLHRLEYYSVDYLGNKEGTRDYNFKVDSVPPVTAVNVTPAEPDGRDGWYRSLPVVALSCNDSGEPSIWVKWNADPYYDRYETPLTVPEGENTLHFYSKDQAGHREPQRFIEFRVDLTPPVSRAVVIPDRPDGWNGYYRVPPSISLVTEELGETVVYSWNDGPENNYTGVPIKAPEGINTLHYYGVDPAGNVEPPKNTTIMVDSRAPATSVVTEPAAPDGSNGWFVTRPLVTFDTELEATVFYRWDSEEFTCVTEPLRPPEGTHTLTYYAVDLAGNREVNRMAAFKVDTVPPSTNISIAPADLGNEWYTRKPRVKLESDSGADIYYYWDQGGETAQKYMRELEVAEGEHTLHYYSIDEAGNREEEMSKSFRVDTVPPSIGVSVSSLLAHPGETVTFNLSGVDANGVQAFFLDYGDGNDTGWTSTTQFSHSYSAPGNYTILAMGRDAAGNEGRGSAMRIEVREVEVQPQPVKPTGGEGLGALPLAGAAIVVIAVVAVGAALAMRRRGRRGEEAGAERAEEERRRELMPALSWAEGGAREETITETAEAEVPLAAAEAVPESRAAGTITCPKCGNETDAEADYCYICGERWGRGGGGRGMDDGG